MKKYLFAAAGVLAMALGLGYAVIGNPVVAINNRELREAVTSVSGVEAVSLNEIVPFDWDTLYTFSPYTSEAEIEEAIGFKSVSIQETVSEGMVQLLFVKGRTITASVCGYPDNLGYNIIFPCFPESISHAENAIFSVDNSSGGTMLIRQ